MASTPAAVTVRSTAAVEAQAGTRLRLAYAGAAVGGTLIASCFLWFQLFPLAWVAFVPLLWSLQQAPTARAAARVGLVAGLATNLPAFYWLVYTIHVFGGFGYPLSLLFYACLSLYAATEFVLFALAWRLTGPGPLALAAPLLWVTLEFLFPSLFPWRMANCQFHAPVLLQIGDVTGPFGLSFVIVWFSAAATAWISRPRRWVPLVAAAGAALLVVLYGTVRLPAVERAIQAAPRIRVALVQGNVGIKAKGDIRYVDVNLNKYQLLSEGLQPDVDVIVWPETVSQRWVRADASRLEGRDLPFDGLRTWLIFGGLAFQMRGPGRADEFNSAFLVGPGGVVLGRYDKHILMPFGEYLPFASYLPAIRSLSPETGGFTAGTGVTLFNIPNKVIVGPLICYEDLLADMSRHAVQAGAEVLLNILNDAWYGNTAAPDQHLALALWRAVENRRYLLRGSNSGVTSIIDATGRIVAEGGLFRPEVVTGTVPRLRLMTFYTRFGDVFGWLVVAGAVCLLWQGCWRRRGQP
ncbi:MAG: apolipoprotein N-acyltransferase [Candidatus Binatia bacterium]